MRAVDCGVGYSISPDSKLNVIVKDSVSSGGGLERFTFVRAVDRGVGYSISPESKLKVRVNDSDACAACSCTGRWFDDNRLYTLGAKRWAKMGRRNIMCTRGC